MCFDTPTSIYHLNNFTGVIPWIPVNKRKEERDGVEEEKEGWKRRGIAGERKGWGRVDLP
jgi:hypothetical protein